ncbi:MAG: PAS domain S-box protein [Opitutaceae bacterium]|nr:PAS domain S-box protein [Cytophagales bacterium]
MDKENRRDSQRLNLLRLYVKMLLSDIWVEKVLLNNLERVKKLKLSTLRQIFDRPHEEVLSIWNKGFIERTLVSFSGNPIEVEKANINRLKTKVDLLIDPQELNLSDIYSIYHEQRLTFLDYIPFFAKTVEESILLVKEIEEYFYEVTSYATNVLLQVQNEMLENSISFSSHLAKSTPDIIYVFDIKAQKYVFINKELPTFLGYTGESLLEASEALSSNIFFDDDKSVLLERYKRYPLLKDDEVLEDTLKAKDAAGNIRFICTRALVFKRSLEGEVLQVMGIAQDITNQKNTETSLKESEAKFRILAQNSTDLITRVSPEGVFLYLSPSSETVLGYKPEELIGKNAFDLYHPEDIKTMQDKFLEVTEIQDIAIARYRVLLKSGEYEWMESTGRTIRDLEGNPIEIHASTRSLKDRMETEQALEKEREYLNAVMESVSEGIVSCDINGEITFFNQAAKDFHNLPPYPISPDEWVDYYDLYQPDSVTKMKKEDVPLFKALHGEIVVNQEMVIAPKNGSKRILLASGKKVFNSNGLVLGAVVAMNDVTEQKRAVNEALESLNELKQIKIELESMNSELEQRVEERTQDFKESEAKYRFMAESIPAIVWTANPDGEIDYYSKRWTDYTGLTLEETVGWGWQILPHPDDLQPTIKAWQKSVINGNEYKIEQRIKGKDGEYRWMLTRAVPFKDEYGKIVKWFGTAVDVNDEKVWAEKLRESEERFRSMADNLPVLAWMADEQGYIFWYNKTWYEYTGTTPEEMEGWGWKSVHDPNELDKVLEKWIHSISTGDTFEMVFPLRGVDGTFHPFLTRVVPVRNQEGKIIKWFGTNTDIYAERQREESIRMQSTVLESMNEGVSVSDSSGIILYTNESEDQMFGYDRGELIGKHVSVQNAYPPQENEEIVSMVIGELKSKGIWEGEWKNIKKDGTVFHTYSFISTLSLENKDLFVCVQRDITEELNYKKEILERNAELESINNDLDNFVYTASHDLKSPVSNIEGLVHAIKDTEYYHIEDLKPLIDMMGTSVDRFKLTILDLTEISRIQKTFTDDIVEVDLNDLMEDVRFSISNQIKDSKALITTDFSEAKNIFFSKKNLRSMLYNLVSNAVKYNSPDRRPEITVKTTKENGFMKITVKDNGLGIRKESLGKLFMMFKRLHTHVEGSGVGLYIVKKMIENAGGRIEVESQEGEGSTFSLFIKTI